jgi:two-component sensor histidine kinase
VKIDAFLAFAQALPEEVFLLRATGEIVAANRPAWRMLGLGSDGAPDETLAAHVAEPAKLIAYLEQCAGSAGGVSGTIVIRGPAGGGACRCDAAQVAPPADGAPAILLLRCWAGQSTTDATAAPAEKVRQLDAEIRQHERIEASLEKALREKEALVRELHHRVKNNLQVLLSIIGLAARDEPDERAKRRLIETRNRVMSMAVVQKLLYQSESFASVNGASLVAELCAELGKSLGRPDIELRIETMPVTIGLQAAVPFGLVLNELVSNALRHAFAEGAAGHVTVGLQQLPGGEIELGVADDGRGMPDVTARRLSAGLNLARGLARQLGGELAIESGHGTRCRLRFSDPGAAQPELRQAL